MSSSYVKSRLKASREAIQAKDWDAAIEAAEQVLNEDGRNYNALVFKGLALLNAGKHDESEQSYRQATDIAPAQALAWQGLDKFYTETRQWSALADVLVEQMGLALDADDATRLAELQQRLVSLQREHAAGQVDVANALANYLYGSKYHDLLATLPKPDQTNPEATLTFEAQMAIHVDSLKVLMEMISLHEANEKARLDREVEKRKTRLDSAAKSREQLRNEIGVEIWQASQLPGLFDQVLAHESAPDEVRREAEHKLLLHRLQLLQALPNPRSTMAGPSGTAAVADGQAEQDKDHLRRKEAALAQVKELAEGIVTINVAEELAWTLVLEWTDVFSLVEYDFLRIRAFVGHFPRSGLALSLRALLLSVQDQQYLKEQKESQEKADVDIAAADPLVLALDGLEQAPASILAHRVAAALYLRDRDWLSCSQVTTAGLSLARRSEASLCIDLEQCKAGLEASLAMALTYLHPPQHHSRAMRLCDAVLTIRPHDVDTLMCKAIMQQANEKWSQARKTLEEVCQLDGDDKSGEQRSNMRTSLAVFDKPGREARLEIAWCDVNLNRLEEAEEELRSLLEEIGKDDTANITDEARGWWRLGICLWRRGGGYRTDRGQAFSCFITALKKDAVYAPAFTSLGLYYQDVASPPDLQRASKCFQKAFELDASQSEAARQLAQIYARDDDWDLVDLVARRSIEAEGGSWILKGGNSNVTRKHITENLWAWSAIGSSELSRGNHEKAIVALQVALRSFPNRAHLWMRLGEAYAASQRFSAAIKAFERAHSLHSPADRWEADFNIATVQLQLGMLDECILAFEHLVRARPNEMAMRTICAGARLERARRDAREGFTLHACHAAVQAVVESYIVLLHDVEVDAAWKTVADGLNFLAAQGSLQDLGTFREQCVKHLLSLAEAFNVDENLTNITAITRSSIEDNYASSTKSADYLLRCSAYFYKLRTILSAGDEKVAGSAWMDLAVALDNMRQNEVARGKGPSTEQVEVYLKQAIACIKEALKLEPGNEIFWLSLGNLVFEHGIPLAQHCYIKAIECNSKSAIPWTNLGLLYFANDDPELATECLTRAQTLEPDFAPVWVGHALLARSKGDVNSSRTMYNNAYILAPGAILEVAYGLAVTTLQSVNAPSQATHVSASHVRASLFALTSYLERRPDDPAAHHLSALLYEHLGDISLAIGRIEAASSIIEAQYEQEESSEKARLFAVCMSNLGRIHLATGQHDRALEIFEMVLGLLEGSDTAQERQVDNEILSSDAVERVRLGAHCGIGMSHAACKEWDAALDALSQAMEETLALKDTFDGDRFLETRAALAIMTAQVLFAKGDLTAAEETLMGEIAEQQSSMTLLMLMGALSAYKGDWEQADVVVSDLTDGLPHISKNSSLLNAAISLLCILLTRQGREGEAIDIIESFHPDAETTLRFVELALQKCDQEGRPVSLKMASWASNATSRLISSMESMQSGSEPDVLLSRALKMHIVARMAQTNTDAEQPTNGEAARDSNGVAWAGDGPHLAKLAAKAVFASPLQDTDWRILHTLLS